MTIEELTQEVVACYRWFYERKIPKYMGTEDAFKRSYLLNVLMAFKDNSFAERMGMSDLFSHSTDSHKINHEFV